MISDRMGGLGPHKFVTGLSCIVRRVTCLLKIINQSDDRKDGQKSLTRFEPEQKSS